MNPMLTKPEVKAWSTPYWMAIELLIVAKDSNGKAFKAKPVEMVEIDPHMSDTSSTVTLDFDSASRLMDDLWRCGIRPSNGDGSAGAFAAVQTHLRDMRAIAFKSLNMETPK